MTNRTFIWITGKPSRRVHIMDPSTERTYCQTENVRRKKRLDGKGTVKPPDRGVCRNCTDLEGRNETDFQEPNIKVLLGERLVGAELDLFAPVVEPKKWKRQARIIRRPKGRKVKRSKVKYPKPFNDDLPPWL